MSACKTCSGSGETGQYGILDCTDCNAATERAALNAAVTSAELMSGYDERWFAYQLGKKAALEEAANVCADIMQDHWLQYKGRGKWATQPNPRRASSLADGASDGASECEDAIRALITPSTKEQQ